nr:5564_t:CDS:2 [Entrophospora candida]CAG8527139.1 8392_t:CDS:2 [Entrophospora candida]
MAVDRLEISITKLQWGLRGAQIFCAFIAIACLAAVISFDNKTTSSTIIDNIFIFFVALSVIMSAAIVGIPYTYLQYGKFQSLARALRVIRIEFVLTAIWSVLVFLVTIALSIELGLRNCDSSSDTAAFERAKNKTGSLFTDGLAGNYEANVNSSKSSLDTGVAGTNNPPQGENVQMQNIHTFAASSSQSHLPTQQPQTQFQQPQTPIQQPHTQFQQPQTQFQQPQTPIQQPQTQFQQPQVPIQQPHTQFQQPQAPYPQTQGPYPQTQGPYPQTQGPYPQTQGPYPPTQGPYPPTQPPFQQPQVSPVPANPQATPSPNIEFPQPQFFPQ